MLLLETLGLDLPEGFSLMSPQQFDQRGGWHISIGAMSKLYTLRSAHWETIYSQVETASGVAFDEKRVWRSYHIQNLGKDLALVKQKLPEVFQQQGIALPVTIYIPEGFTGKLDGNAAATQTPILNFTFGKHAGLTPVQVKEVDPEYLVWYIYAFKPQGKSQREIQFVEQIQDLMQADLERLAKTEVTTFPFGKYAGKSIDEVKEVDLGYLLWYAKQEPPKRPDHLSFYKNVQAAIAPEKAKQQSFLPVCQQLATVFRNTWLVDYYPSVIAELEQGELPRNEKILSKMADAYGKEAGRPNSNAYKKKYDEFWDLVDPILGRE